MMSSDNQINCCALLKKKDRDTFDFLYSEFNSQFYGMALQFLGNKDLADEIMIITFTNIWKDLQKFKGNDSQLRSWCTSKLVCSIKNFVSAESSAHRLKAISVQAKF